MSCNGRKILSGTVSSPPTSWLLSPGALSVGCHFVCLPFILLKSRWSHRKWVGNGLLCCSIGLPVSLTVLLSSPRGLLTPSNDCFPFRNGIFLDKSISHSSSPTLWQSSEFSSVSFTSFSGHIKPSPAAWAQEMQEPRAPSSLLCSELTPSTQGPCGVGTPLVETLGPSSWDCSEYFFLLLSSPSLAMHPPSASVGGWWFQLPKTCTFLN